MKLPTDWQCRHIYIITIFFGFALTALGLIFMDGFITCIGMLVIVFAAIIFDFVLPEHGDPWSKRNADESADGKPDGQEENDNSDATEG